MLFFLLFGLALVVSGLTAYVIIWPLVATHLRDRHPGLRADAGASPFAPQSFLWYLRRGYRGGADPNLSLLAIPGCIGAWAIAIGGVSLAIYFLLRWLHPLT